jgi:PIN domain nuclease of toxin-antitoxin system
MGCNEVKTEKGSTSQLLLLDTHVLVWLMFGESRLGARAKDAIARASREERLRVSAITPWEIGVLVYKKRLDLHRDLMTWVSMPGIALVPLDPEIAVGSTCLPFEMHPDPADRILVATARQIGATLVTADRALLALAEAGNFRAVDAGA